MEVQDQAGKKVSELNPGKSKGINVVTWNFRIKQPKMAKGKTFASGGFTSPRVKAGTYKVVINKGKNKYETDLVVINDTTSLLTDAERAQLHKVTMQLYDMVQDLAYMVYKLDAYTDRARKLTRENPKAKKVAQPVIDALTSLKETLVITKGDNYVGTVDPELREKMATLYSKIAGGYLPPSASEMENLKMISDDFDKAKAEFKVIEDKQVAKMNKFITKQKLAPAQIKSFEEFIE